MSPSHVTSRSEPQLVVVGTRVDGTWHYMKSKPMDYEDALRAALCGARAFRATRAAKRTTVFMRAADDPTVADYPEGP